MDTASDGGICTERIQMLVLHQVPFPVQFLIKDTVSRAKPTASEKDSGAEQEKKLGIAPNLFGFST